MLSGPQVEHDEEEVNEVERKAKILERRVRMLHAWKSRFALADFMRRNGVNKKLRELLGDVSAASQHSSNAALSMEVQMSGEFKAVMSQFEGEVSALVERFDIEPYSDFSAKLSNFRGLVLFCIEADFCNQILIF